MPQLGPSSRAVSIATALIIVGFFLLQLPLLDAIYRFHFDEKYYTQLPGGILESFGRLFKYNLKLYVYPLKETSGEMTTVDNFAVSKELTKLYGYLADRGSFVGLDNF